MQEVVIKLALILMRSSAQINFEKDLKIVENAPANWCPIERLMDWKGAPKVSNFGSNTFSQFDGGNPRAALIASIIFVVINFSGPRTKISLKDLPDSEMRAKRLHFEKKLARTCVSQKLFRILFNCLTFFDWLGRMIGRLFRTWYHVAQRNSENPTP